jgi:hypothetical protein
LSFLQVFRHLLGLGSFDSPKNILTRKWAFLPITFNGIKFIPSTTITLTIYLRSWALVVSFIAVGFMIDQHPCLFETLIWIDNFPFQQHFKVACDLLPFQVQACFLVLNNSLDNKWFIFKIPFKNVCTMISFLTCFLTRYNWSALFSNFIMF